MQISRLDWNTAARAVDEADSILVVTHVSPDGDAFGSMLGIVNALRARGKKVDCAVDGGVLDFARFLPGADLVKSRLNGGQWDLMISADASDEERTGLVGIVGRSNSRKVINLDHHATNTGFGDIHLVDPDAVSATEVVFRWLKSMDWEVSLEIAMPLLTGLVTDTIGFRTSNVTAETLEIAQYLMTAGASLTEITERTLDNKSYLTVNLWKEALASVQLHRGGIITAEVTRENLKRAGLSETTDGGLVGFLIKVNEAMIAVVFKEVEDGRIEIGMRSKPGFDVAGVALELGGGGHKQASGATIDGPLDEAKKRVLSMVRRAARQGKLVIV